MADRISDQQINWKLGRLEEMMEQAKDNRAEQLLQLADIRKQLETLNNRTRKLEDDNGRSKEVWRQVADMAVPVDELLKQVAAMREPFQTVSSALRVYQVWRWRALFFVLLAFSAGNQAFRVMFDFVIKYIASALGFGPIS